MILFSRLHGFTIFELMVAMAIVAITLSLAVPAFKNYGWNLRMKTAMDTLQADLNLARARAINHGYQTVVCPATGSDACSRATGWQDGWMVFTDLNGDRRRQAAEPLHKIGNPVEFLSITSPRSRTMIRFFPNGSAPGSNTSIVFCDQRGARHANRIIVSNTGRIRQETGSGKATAACR